MSTDEAIAQAYEGLQMPDGITHANRIQEIAEFTLRVAAKRLKRQKGEGVDASTLKVKSRLVMAATRALVGPQHTDEASRTVSISMRNIPNNDEFDDPAQIVIRCLRMLGYAMAEAMPAINSGSIQPDLFARLVGKGVAMHTLYDEASVAIRFAKRQHREMAYKWMPEESREICAQASDCIFDLIHRGVQALEGGQSIIEYAKMLHESDQSTDPMKEWAAMVGLFDQHNPWHMMFDE